MPAALAGATSNVINGVVNSLMQNKVYQSQADAIQLQSKLAYLNTQQKYDLAMRLQNAQNMNDQLQILSDAVSQINVATVNGNTSIIQTALNQKSKNTIVAVLVIFGSIAVLGVTYYFIYEKK